MRGYQHRTPYARPLGLRGTLRSMFLVVFLAGGLFSAYLFFASVRDIVAYAELPFSIAGLAGSPSGGEPDIANPVSKQQLTQRVNILFLGIDRRDNDPGPWRTDTMILFSVEPVSKTASMLSIPRDLWVPLPGLNTEERINAAYVYGASYPGGGAAYAKRTVQYNLGIPVHYYVALDFNGFVKIIDAVGGIDVDVPADIVDNAYPTPNYGTMRLVIRAGRQHMDGDLALKYARTRHSGNDIDRARRQQQVIAAVRDKVLSLNFPVARIPEQLRILGTSLQTDMSPTELLAIAQAARQVEDINAGVIDANMVVDATTPEGAMVLLPKRDKIRELVSRLFPMPTPTVSLDKLGDRDTLALEAARIEVQNGTEIPGLASKMATELRSRGYNVVRFGDADRSDYRTTAIICFVDKRYSLASLQAYLNIPEDRVRRQDQPGSGVDICVILGGDMALR